MDGPVTLTPSELGSLHSMDRIAYLILLSRTGNEEEFSELVGSYRREFSPNNPPTYWYMKVDRSEGQVLPSGYSSDTKRHLFMSPSYNNGTWYTEEEFLEEWKRATTKLIRRLGIVRHLTVGLDVSEGNPHGERVSNIQREIKREVRDMIAMPPNRARRREIEAEAAARGKPIT